MPDINLDTLFIVGLILASLIGKIFKKKEPDDSVEKKIDSDTSLEDALKDAWQKVTKQPEEKTEPTPPLPTASSLKITEVEKPPLPVISASPEIESIIDSTLNDSISGSIWDSNDSKVESRKRITYKKQLSSKASLKSAFVLREILDQPVSIRRENQ
jgi:hypothetical protein